MFMNVTMCIVAYMLRHKGGKIGYIYIMQMIKLTMSLNMLYKQEERNGKLLRNHHPHHSLTLCGVMDLTVLHGIAHTVYTVRSTCI